MDFIDEINIVNNPIKEIPSDIEIHSNIKFYLNTLMQKFDSVAARHSVENQKHKIYRSLHVSQNNSSPQKKTEEL